MMLSPSLFAALIQRHHGQVILTREEVFDAGLLGIRASENERGEIVLRTVPPTCLESEGHEDHDPDS